MTRDVAGSAGDGDSTRERILKEASKLFAVKGYRGTSTREIAAAVGIRQPSLFHHFESKRAIMQALLDYDLGEPTEVAQAEADANGSPALRLYRYLVWDVAYVCRSPYDLAGLIDDDIMSDPDFAPWMERLDRLRAARRSMIEQAIAAGEFIDVDPEFAHRAITWMITGHIADLGDRRVPDAEQIADQVASFAIRALLADPSALDGIRTAGRDGASDP